MVAGGIQADAPATRKNLASSYLLAVAGVEAGQWGGLDLLGVLGVTLRVCKF